MQKDVFNFQITTMPASRPADYYLTCLDGCVFLDFNNINGVIYLVRMSFDGFGCCNLGAESKPLNEVDSAQFIGMFQRQCLEQNIMEILVKKLVLINQSIIWQDAIEQYNLA